MGPRTASDETLKLVVFIDSPLAGSIRPADEGTRTETCSPIEINFDTVALLQHHLAVPPFNAFDLVIGGEVGRQIVHGNGAREGGFAAVSVNEALSGFNDFVEGLAGLEFILHGLQGATRDVPRIFPILQVGFFHH